MKSIVLRARDDLIPSKRAVLYVIVVLEVPAKGRRFGELLLAHGNSRFAIKRRAGMGGDEWWVWLNPNQVVNSIRVSLQALLIGRHST